MMPRIRDRDQQSARAETRAELRQCDDPVLRASALSAIGTAFLDSHEPSIRSVAKALCDWFEEGCVEPLDVALKVVAAGHRHPARRIWKDRRDILVRNASRHLGASADMSASAKARLLVAKWRLYKTTRWRQDRKLTEPPVREPEATFFALLSDGHEPVGWDRVARILRK